MGAIRSVGHGIGVGFWLVVFLAVAVFAVAVVGVFLWSFASSLVGQWKWIAAGCALLAVGSLASRGGD